MESIETPLAPEALAAAKKLSPKRKTSQATTLNELANEQLCHLGITPDSDYGRTLHSFAVNLYQAQQNVEQLWTITNETLAKLDKSDRIAYFNAKKFLSFQLAKILDTLQNPFRTVFQSLNRSGSTKMAKGHYPLFDNVTAIFSATPVVVRTATYIYACTEWVDDAFQGKEPSHQIYSRLMNPTNISLANAIVELEAGPYAGDYLAWNFNSGMAAIDAVLSNVLRRDDVLLVSRNIYGGVHQLINDYFSQEDRLAVKVEWFDGYTGEAFEQRLAEVKAQHRTALENGSKLHIYLESPCNPHGYTLDVPAICRIAHDGNHVVMLDSTLATPVLSTPLQHPDKAARPDYVIHSYTKDMVGSGSVTAGGVIGENHRMFLPKGETCQGVCWDQTLFWDVYYVKGAFLDSEKAFEVLNGMKTMQQRMLAKCINTQVFTRFLASNPWVRVNSHALQENENYALAQTQLNNGLPSALFTIDMEKANLPREAFVRFFDSLEPAFSHMVSIGQNNTMLLCPALTSHSELSEKSLLDAHIYLTTIRISMGTEDVRELIAHFLESVKLHLDPVMPGFSQKFMSPETVDHLLMEMTLDTHRKQIQSQPALRDIISELGN